MAHGSQKRACPHGTNAKPARGATWRLRSSRQRLMQLTIPTPSTDSFLISTQQ